VRRLFLGAQACNLKGIQLKEVKKVMQLHLLWQSSGEAVPKIQWCTASRMIVVDGRPAR